MTAGVCRALPSGIGDDSISISASLAEAAHLAVDSADLDAALEGIAGWAVHALGGATAEVALLTADGNTLEVGARASAPAASERPPSDCPVSRWSLVLLEPFRAARESRAVVEIAPSGPATALLRQHHARHGLVAPLVDDDRVAGFLAVYRETTARFSADDRAALAAFAAQAALAIRVTRLQADLRGARESVAGAARLHALGELASGVAHDFNNLLTGVLGNAQLALAEPDLSPRARRRLEVIQKAALDGAATVRRIQSFGKAESCDRHMPLDLAEAAADALEVTRPLWQTSARARGVSMHVETRLEPNVVVLGDPAQVREVLINLISNAVQAMMDGGRLRVVVDADAADAIVTVADTGEGISEELNDRIFEPFFTTKGSAGTGLGLSVSRQIVAAHGGEIGVESAPRQGAVFTVRLPRVIGSVTSPALADAEEPAPPRRVLVVDDDPVVRDAVSELLRLAGQTVSVAASGADALARLAREPVDVVLTDMGMPGMNGAELASRVKALHPGTRVALLTGWADSLRQAPPPPQVDLILGKPVQLPQLLRDLAEIDPRCGSRMVS